MPATRKNRMSDKDFDILKKHLSASFRTQVQFSCNAQGREKITFPLKNEDELEQLIAIFDTLKKSDS